MQKKQVKKSLMDKFARGFQRLSDPSTLLSRVALVAKELGVEKELEKKFKAEYATYVKNHPKTEKSESEFVKNLLDRGRKAPKKDEDNKDTDKSKDKGNKDNDKSKDNDNDKEKKDKSKDLSDADIAGDIDPEQLDTALDSIIGDDGDDDDDDDKDKKDIGEKLEMAAKYLTEMLDVDDYILGLPEEAGQLAEHLRGVKKEDPEKDKAKAEKDEKAKAKKDKAEAKAKAIKDKAKAIKDKAEAKAKAKVEKAKAKAEAKAKAKK